MRGVWNDEHVRCSARRRLAVTMLVDHGGGASPVPAGSSTATAPRAARTSASRSAPARPNGAWKPGYNFVTTTVEPTRKLLATASLLWNNSKRC
jgi:hypothetical protein